ncbi:MAG TPA: dihydrodipicolinate reductase C-terminal domain-containing protein [Gemmatimonadales bacterium]|nr:dihydrodipicolinate reductase C-terminal domain-containing protein [Gemmatimonadales bacterium]
MRIALVGYGRMGHAVEAAALARGHTIHARIDPGLGKNSVALTPESLRGADVAIEFTAPDAAPGNLKRLIEAGVPVVTGTTGWRAELPAVSSLVAERGGALLHSANFSVGVHLFLRAARELAARFADHPDFDAFILEEHHGQKLDAPSGTALTLQQEVRSADPSRRYPVTSIRAGAIPGIHTLTYDGPHDTVVLSHTARSRHGFATGAVLAAEWLPGRRGVFTFEDMLFGGNP